MPSYSYRRLTPLARSHVEGISLDHIYMAFLEIVSRGELLDEVQIRAINFANDKKLPEIPTLMFEFVGTEAYAREQTQIVQKIASEHNGSDFVFAEEPEEKKELWTVLYYLSSVCSILSFLGYVSIQCFFIRLP
ncbi:hypothetical protein RND71_005715 [Anisodus tanguticus]|uniref:FAD-binding oxidoreductase/transferase type 4 C-terminal domain-containing protein n=1 Tax=Anisodus tanguticus TaxID=243964 RepID=A0AAE1VLR7_9SOLA|nr:hypothetical protein RND71_005715 [Anisodus tanguticus]